MPRGGARTGAGRPKGGVSRMRMMLEEAARKGMAEAYQYRRKASPNAGGDIRRKRMERFA